MVKINSYLRKLLERLSPANAAQAGLTIGRDSVTVLQNGRCSTHPVTGPLNLEYVFDHERRQWLLSLSSGASREHVLYSERFAEIDFDAGKAAYVRITRQMQAASAAAATAVKRPLWRRAAPWAGGAALMYVSLVVIGAAMGIGTQQAGERAQGDVSQAGAPGSVAPSAPSTPAPRLDAGELARVAAAAHVSIGTPGKKRIYVFSDPLCPSCKRLDVAASQIGEDYDITVIPVAFKDGSQELAAKVLCAADRKAAWRAVLAQAHLEGPACDAGIKQVQANNELFASLGFGMTPTLASSTGALAVGDAPAADLAKWMGMF